MLLGIEQFTESENGGERQSGALRHLDSAAEIFVEHPLGNKKLPPIGKSHLYLAGAE